VPLISIPAHFDGTHVTLDEDVSLSPASRLIVTVLDDTDTERDEFLRSSGAQLEAAMDDDEVEYSEIDLEK
jgi:hypothetical protein